MTVTLHPILRGAGLGLAVLAWAQPGPALAGAARSARDAAIQALADVTLIDARCRGVRVAFGTAFGLAAVQGLDVTDVMPGSRLRRRFEAAMDRRTAATPPEQLCGALAKDYETASPGLVTRP